MMQDSRSSQGPQHDHVEDNQLLQLAKAVFSGSDPSLDMERFANLPPQTQLSKPIDREYLPEIPGYDITRQTKRGGQGVVFEAFQRSTKRRVAIKVLLEGIFARPSHQQRFEMEIELAGSLRHPNIVRIYDSGIVAGHPYLVMEYIDGVTLREYLGKQPLTTRQVLALFSQICEAVGHAHDHGVIHRDLSPSNILVDELGNCHLFDFGLAQRVNEDPASATRTFVGTIAYASPEHVSRTNSPVGALADVYAIGVMLYEAISGRLPYDTAGSLLDAAQQICEQTPTPLAKPVSSDLNAVVLKALAKEPAARFSSVAEFRDDLRRILDNRPVLARPCSTAYQLRKWVRRHTVITSLMLLVAILGISSFITTKKQHRLAMAERDKAAHAYSFIARTLQDVQPSETGETLSLTTILSRAGQRVDETLRDAPEVALMVEQTIGSSFRRVKAYDAALRHLTRAHQLAEQQHGSRSPEVATCLFSLGLLHRQALRIPESQYCFGQSYALRRDSLGHKHPLTILAKMQWALSMHDNGQHRQAGNLLQDSLHECKSTMQHQPRHTRFRLKQLMARAYRALGQHDNAISVYNAILSRRRQVHGDNSLRTAQAVAFLASTYRDQGNVVLAKQRYEEVLEVRLRHLDDRHPLVVEAMNQLAFCKMQMGDLAEAEVLFRKCRQRAEVQPLHRQSSLQFSNIGLADTLCRQERYAEAKEILEPMIDSSLDHALNEHAHWGRALQLAAEVALHESHPHEAYDLANRALKIHVRLLAPDHWMIVHSRHLIEKAIRTGKLNAIEPSQGMHAVQGLSSAHWPRR